jgi:spore coat polysaccharide biosynthesis protein SpsF
MSSSRCPGKVMAIVNGRPLIEWQIRRIERAKFVNRIVVATSVESSDDILAEYLMQIGVEVYRGDLENVMGRFIGVITEFVPDTVIRLTGDCPLTMPNLIDEMASNFDSNQYDYMSNAIEPTFPDGLDIEIFKASALNRLSKFELSSEEKEHVTLGFLTRKQEFAVGSYKGRMDYSHERWTVDYPEDLEFMRKIYSKFVGRETQFTMDEIILVLKSDPAIVNKISSQFRNRSLSQQED